MAYRRRWPPPPAHATRWWVPFPEALLSYAASARFAWGDGRWQLPAALARESEPLASIPVAERAIFIREER
jgi:hypothetical protein